MILLGVVLFLFLFSTTSVKAVSILVSTPSASIDQSQELDLDILLSCSSCGDSYLRGVFFETGDNYFGFTQNNSGEWIGTSSDRTKYFKVAKESIVDSTWSGKLKIKIDKDNSYYKGPGNYSLKVGRYTSSIGSSATWSDNFLLSVTGPSPTPTPTLSPTSTPSPSSTPGPTNTPAPSHTPKPTPTVRPSSTPKPSNTPKPIPTEKVIPTLVMPTGEVMGEAVENKSSSILRWIGLILGGVGSVMIAVAASQIWQKNDTIPPA